MLSRRHIVELMVTGEPQNMLEAMLIVVTDVLYSAAKPLI